MADSGLWFSNGYLSGPDTIGASLGYSGRKVTNPFEIMPQKTGMIAELPGIWSRLYFALYFPTPAGFSYNVRTYFPRKADYLQLRLAMSSEEQFNRQEVMKRDADCIHRIRSGDAQAFAELVRAYYPIYYHLVMGITANPDQAEDLVQEGFIAIYANLEALKQPERFGSWGYTLMKRIATRFSWRLKKELNLSISKDPVVVSLLEQCFSGGKSHVSQADEERFQALWEAIRKLSDKYREVIILYFFHEYTLKEISRILEISEAAAEKRLARSRELLRKKMEVSQ